MIFWKRKTNMTHDPAFALAEMRTAIAEIVDKGHAAGLRHFMIERALEDAAKVVATRHAMTTPIL
jgi:hypothetical protein